MEALVNGRVWDAEGESVTGAGRLREWFSYAATSGTKVKSRLWEFAQQK